MPAAFVSGIAASATDTNVVTAVANKRVRVYAVVVSGLSTASAVTFNTKPAGAGTAISAAIGPGVPLPHTNTEEWFKTNLSEGLTLSTPAGATTNSSVHVIYRQD